MEKPPALSPLFLPQSTAHPSRKLLPLLATTTSAEEMEHAGLPKCHLYSSVAQGLVSYATPTDQSK